MEKRSISGNRGCVDVADIAHIYTEECPENYYNIVVRLNTNGGNEIQIGHYKENHLEGKLLGFSEAWNEYLAEDQ